VLDRGAANAPTRRQHRQRAGNRPLADRKAVLNRQRQARHLDRHKAGIAIAGVAYDGRCLDGLVRAGLLSEAEAGDQAAINRAISLFLADEFSADGLRKFVLMR
jgi:hypothetical protein